MLYSSSTRGCNPLLAARNREVVKSVLGFIKLCVHSPPTEVIDEDLPRARHDSSRGHLRESSNDPQSTDAYSEQIAAEDHKQQPDILHLRKVVIVVFIDSLEDLCTDLVICTRAPSIMSQGYQNAATSAPLPMITTAIST